MTTRRRLLSNTAVVIAGTAVQRLLNFVTTLVLARGLGEEQFGTYSFVVAYMFMFGFLVDLGFERVITREVARQPQRAGELLGNGFIIRGGLSLLAAAVAIGVAWLLQLPALTRLCILIAAVGMPLSIESLVRGFFQARFEMHYTFLLTLPGSLAFLVLARLVIATGGGLPAVMITALATGVATVGLMLRFAVPRIGVVWRLNPALLRYLWRESWELGAVILLFLIALRLDQLLLYWLRGASEVADYAVAVKVTEALNAIPEAIMVTVFPLLAASQHSAPERFRRAYHLVLRYLIVLVLPLALLLTLEAEDIIRTLFGPLYVSGARALTLMAWWMFFSYTAAAYLNLMIVRRQQRLIALVSAVAVALNLTLNLLWIPRWGSAGAAAATLASSATSFALFWFAPPTREAVQVACGEAVRPVVAIAATATALSLVANPQLRALGVFPVYAVFVLLLGGINRQDLAWMATLLQPAQRRG